MKKQSSESPISVSQINSTLTDNMCMNCGREVERFYKNKLCSRECYDEYKDLISPPESWMSAKTKEILVLKMLLEVKRLRSEIDEKCIVSIGGEIYTVNSKLLRVLTNKEAKIIENIKRFLGDSFLFYDVLALLSGDISEKKLAKEFSNIMKKHRENR